MNLTPTESAIVACLIDGLTAKNTSRAIGLAVNTIRWHQTRIYRKLGARNKTHAAAIAAQML